MGGFFLSKKSWNQYKNEFEIKAQKAGKSTDYIIENLNYAKHLYNKNLPIIYDSTHLSYLIGVNQEYLYKVANKQKLFYRKFYIKKKNGTNRLIHEPLPNLKIIQSWILQNILHNIQPSEFAKAYIPKGSIKENVRFHKGQKLVLKLDIENFFGNVSEREVYSVFKALGFHENLTVLFSKLCTLHGSLPQGASTSAYLSNLILRDFDEKVSEYCLSKKIRYTRYADDLTFSGNFNYKDVIKVVTQELKKINLKLNTNKTRVLRQNQSQIVTGIVVNKKIQISSRYRRRIRLELYYIQKFGLYDHLRETKSKLEAQQYIISILGKINYCLFINPHDLEMQKYRDIMNNLKQKFNY